MSDGNMKVSIKNENGMMLSKDYGFTIQEEQRILGFDLHEHPQLGTMILFGDQVFALKYWKSEDIEKGMKLLEDGFQKELERRKNGTE